METMKYCSKCDTTKPIEQFSKYRRSSDGHAWQCKACIKTYQQANKEKLKAYQKEYQPKYKAEHREELLAYLSNYQKTIGKEKHLAYIKKWRAANPEKVKEYTKTSNERIKLKNQANEQ